LFAIIKASKILCEQKPMLILITTTEQKRQFIILQAVIQAFNIVVSLTCTIVALVSQEYYPRLIPVIYTILKLLVTSLDNSKSIKINKCL
jgi:hypothetical protein